MIRALESAATRSPVVRHVAEREKLPDVRRDPVARRSVGEARCARVVARLGSIASTVAPGQAVAYVSRCPQMFGRFGNERAERVHVRRRTHGVEAPARALPRHQRHERVDHRRRRRHVAVVTHEPDADGVRVVVQCVRAHHVAQVELTRVHETRGVVPRPAAFVDPSVRIDEPVVCDIDVAVVQLVGEDATREPGIVGDVIRRSGVMHDELANRRVVVTARLAERLVRAPLRARNDRRRGPVEASGPSELGADRGRRSASRARVARDTARPPPPHRRPGPVAARRAEKPRAGNHAPQKLRGFPRATLAPPSDPSWTLRQPPPAARQRITIAPSLPGTPRNRRRA